MLKCQNYSGNVVHYSDNLRNEKVYTIWKQWNDIKEIKKGEFKTMQTTIFPQLIYNNTQDKATLSLQCNVIQN